MNIKESWLTWNDGTVPKIVKAILEEMDYDRCPILADALEDAGCDNVRLLQVLRSPCVGNVHASRHFEVLLDIECQAEWWLTPYHAWHSRKMDLMNGCAIYRQAGMLVRVTEIRNIKEPFNGWGDNVYLGVVRMKDLVREHNITHHDYITFDWSCQEDLTDELLEHSIRKVGT